MCERIGEVPTTALQEPVLCPDGECLDPIMLRNLDKRMAELPTEQRNRGTVVVMHQMGSHGPAYFKRSAPALKKFQPECTSTNLQECTQAPVVNAYDNSIVQTDEFLDSVINWLSAQADKAQTAMIFITDHGESMGESNIDLHSLPYPIAPDVQTTAYLPGQDIYTPCRQNEA